MHRHRHIDPLEDTILKIKEVSPVKGRVLDTCCGLGYTAIFAAQRAEYVITVEKDPSVVQLCKYNPFSEELFINKKIKIVQADIIKKIKTFSDCSFDRVIHD